MKKIVVIAIIVALVPFLSIAIVNAEPVWDTFGMYPWVNFKITGSGLHIASDPLFSASDIGDIDDFIFGVTFGPFDEEIALMKGWVNFVCASDQPSGNNLPTGFDFSITVKGLARGRYNVLARGSTTYALGTLTVGRSGEGELKGFYDLGAGFYVWQIEVYSGSTLVLQTHPSDPADFFVVA
jgi:hypothetical protein